MGAVRKFAAELPLPLPPSPLFVLLANELSYLSFITFVTGAIETGFPRCPRLRSLHDIVHVSADAFCQSWLERMERRRFQPRPALEGEEEERATLSPIIMQYLSRKFRRREEGGKVVEVRLRESELVSCWNVRFERLTGSRGRFYYVCRVSWRRGGTS